MGTRGFVARGRADKYVGRYHHWDSYPTALEGPKPDFAELEAKVTDAENEAYEAAKR